MTRVTKGGKRFNFRRPSWPETGKGEVGVGMGKASDTAGAIEKLSETPEKPVQTEVDQRFFHTPRNRSQVWKQCDYNQAGQRQRTCRRKLGQNGF